MIEGFDLVNILDMMDVIGEDKVREVLSDFSCSKNREIEDFVKNDAIGFAKRKMSVTYLLINESGELSAIFALTHKAVEISNSGLSASGRKKIMRYASLDDKSNSFTLSAFLIAQLGKNFNGAVGEKPSGNSLLEEAMNVLQKVQHEVGGGVVYLECEDELALLSFYENESNGFRPFGERLATGSNYTKYIRLLRFF